MSVKSFRLLSIAVILVMLFTACGKATPATSSTNEKVNLTFWWWAESDAPGADAWMTETVAAYKQIKPNVTINIVPQSSDTLFSAFQSAVTANSGPDIASQWATGPVLDFVWQNAVVPVSDYVPADEMKNWLNTNENTYSGKVWGAPMYLIGIEIMYNKTMFAQAALTPPANGRWTWDEFLAACAKLKAAGLTPFVGGDKDGFLGGWWLSHVGMQGLDSTEDLRQAIIGNKDFTDPHYTGWYSALDDMVKKGYFNQDVMSLDLNQGVQAFSQSKGAMTWGTDGMIKQAQTDLGSDKVGVMRTPTYGTGKLADAGNATQSITFYITKWAKYPQETADFLVFMHSADRLTSWYKHTSVIAADARFDRSLVTDPVLKQMMEWETTGTQIWLENYLPGQLDSDADWAAGQMIFSQSGTPADAAALWQRTAASWRTQHPDVLTNWKNWQQ